MEYQCKCCKKVLKEVQYEQDKEGFMCGTISKEEGDSEKGSTNEAHYLYFCAECGTKLGGGGFEEEWERLMELLIDEETIEEAKGI